MIIIIVGVMPTSRHPRTGQLLSTAASRCVLTKEETKDSKACKGLGDAAHEGQNAPEEDQDRRIGGHRKLLEQ